MCKNFLFTGFMFLLCGCSTPEKLICRTWKVDAVDFGPPKSEFEAKIQQSVKNMVPDLSFTFKSDSTYVGGKKEAPTIGRWWFTGKKKNIVMTSEKQNTDAQILTLTKTKLVLDNTGPQGNKIKFTLSVAATGKK